tara:strand:- start:78 stop:572 length:495 start_codon:yes stop_codon:yes gene_type:complete
MKLTKKVLRELIKEEIENISEANFDGKTGKPLTLKGWQMISKLPNNPYYKQAMKMLASGEWRKELAGGGDSVDQRGAQQQKLAVGQQSNALIKKFVQIDRDFQAAVAELDKFTEAGIAMSELSMAKKLVAPLGELPFNIARAVKAHGSAQQQTRDRLAQAKVRK